MKRIGPVGKKEHTVYAENAASQTAMVNVGAAVFRTPIVRNLTSGESNIWVFEQIWC